MFWLMVMFLLVSIVIAFLIFYFGTKYSKAITVEKGNDKFVVCTLDGDKLIPQAVYDCESDARQHSLFMASKVIVRVRKSELELLRSIKHVSK